jgi:hypothetical protein
MYANVLFDTENEVVVLIKESLQHTCILIALMMFNNFVSPQSDDR